VVAVDPIELVVFNKELLRGQYRVCECVAMVKKPTVFPPKVRSFLSHCFSQTS